MPSLGVRSPWVSKFQSMYIQSEVAIDNSIAQKTEYTKCNLQPKPNARHYVLVMCTLYVVEFNLLPLDLHT